MQYNTEIFPIISRTQTSIRFRTPHSSFVAQNTVAWLEIWNTMLEFLNVSRECTYRHPVVLDPPVMPTTTTTRTHKRLSSSMMASIPKRLFSFSRLRKHHHHPKEIPQTPINILDLPIEVLSLIFEYVNEPYVLKGGTWEFQREFYTETNIMFDEPRDWAHMNVFRVCRAFRALAIACYGEPEYNTLPFDPCRDFVSIRVHPRMVGGPPMQRAVRYPQTHDHIPIEARSPQYTDMIRGWDLFATTYTPFDNSVNGLFFFRAYLFNMTYQSKLVRFSPALASRIQKVEILADENWFRVPWNDITSTLERNLGHMRHLRLRVARPDFCCSRLAISRLESGSWTKGERPQRWANRFGVTLYPPAQGIPWRTPLSYQPQTVRQTLEAATALDSGPNIIHPTTRTMLRLIWMWLNPDIHLSNDPSEAPPPTSIVESERLKGLEVLEVLIDRNICTKDQRSPLSLNQPQEDGKPRWETWVEI